MTALRRQVAEHPVADCPELDRHLRALRQIERIDRETASIDRQRENRATSLAKQFEEVFLPGQPDPVRLPRQSEALYMLQRIRDEAHRFAISYHRQLRAKRMTKSVLDGIPGLGETRKKRLNFHSLTMYGLEFDGSVLGDHDNTGLKPFLRPDTLRFEPLDD